MSSYKQPKTLAESVEVVAKPWQESAYYDRAEEATHMFWGEKTIFRQMFAKLDLTSTIELSCGHGRHAEKTAQMTNDLTLVDIHDGNLDFCRERLSGFGHVGYVKTNGYSFTGIADEKATAIYCYDSMVHFSPDIVESYLKDTARVLKPGGMALFHHSNYAAPLDRHYGQNPHARNHMTKEMFTDLASNAGLEVVENHVINWGAEIDLDCVTLVRKPA